MVFAREREMEKAHLVDVSRGIGMRLLVEVHYVRARTIDARTNIIYFTVTHRTSFSRTARLHAYKLMKRFLRTVFRVISESYFVPRKRASTAVT